MKNQLLSNCIEFFALMQKCLSHITCLDFSAKYYIELLTGRSEIMTERTMVIAILVELILLWFAETLNMKKTSKVLGGAIDLAFAILR